MRRLAQAAAIAAAAAGLVLTTAAAPPPAKGAVKKFAVKDTASASYAALADLTERVPRDQWPYTRYLSLYDVPKEARDDHARVLNFWANSLSRRSLIYLTTRVPGTDDALLRVNLYDLGWDPEHWDQLVEGSRYYLAKQLRTQKVADVEEYEEPKYEVRQTKVLVPNGYGGYVEQVKEEKVQVGVVKRTREVAVRDKQEAVLTVGPWVEPGVAAELLQKTQSVYPLMFGREFLDATSDDKFYKLFLRIGDKEADFHALVDGDPGAVRKLGADRQGAVTFSGVTLRNRRLTRLPTRSAVRGGYLWFTTDARTDVAAKNFLEILLDRGALNFDASEQIGSLPNGLQAYGLFNNKAERQAEAPPDIAGDKNSTSNDLRVRNPVSCVRCHVEGIIPFKSVFPQLRRSIKVEAYRKDDLYLLDQLYGADIEETFAHDQGLYAGAVKKAAGKDWTPLKVAQAYARVYHEWGEAPVTIETAAVDLGVPVAEARRVLRQSERNTILTLVADDPVPISRSQWAAVFPEAAVLLFNSRVREAERAALPHIDPPVDRPRVRDFEKAFPRHGKADDPTEEKK